MSQYPYGYDQWPGQPAAQPYNSQPPTYPNAEPHDPNSVEGNFVMSQASFDYNASRIPGLGISGPSPGSNAQFSANNAGWMPGVSTTMATAASGLGQYPIHTHSPSLYLLHGGQAEYPLPQASVPRPSVATESSRNYVTEEVMEEGELSEGIFDDLYEPAEPVDDVATSNYPPGRAPESPASEEASHSDLQDNAFYEEEPGEILSESNDAPTSKSADVAGATSSLQQKPRQVDRDRTGSYSPYLSPREIHHEDETSDVTKAGTAPEKTLKENHDDTSRGGESSPLPRSNGVEPIQNQLQGDREPKDQPTMNGMPFKSVDEAKKEAQKSILRLIPYGVKFQTYVDEGFDEKVIKSLFTELGLNPSTSSGERVRPTVTQAELPSPEPQQTSSKSSSGSIMEKTEERKDKIARLLALKKSKPATVTPISQPAPKAGATVPEKGRSEKELLLQKKMEALQKAREDRAKKAAETTHPPEAAESQQTAPTPVISQSVSSSIPEAQNSAGSRLVQSSSLQPSLSQSPQPEQATQSGSGPPQLLTSQNAMPLANLRKRPIASDFVDYSSAAGSHKRPFGQSRQASSLVIDVSDGSDDEDVEMEMDSPAEAQSSFIQRTDSPARKSFSIRDFPPLSDTFSQRHYASSTSSLPTPPSGLGNGGSRSKEDEYSRKIKAIEEMKRKIAEAEARKARRTPAGAQTPGANGTPPAGEVSDLQVRRTVSMSDVDKNDAPSAQLLPEAVSAQLAKPSHLANISAESKWDRRVRISSVHLPKAEAHLQEKMSKLRILQDKVARLQAEVDAALAEKQRLTVEMDGLSDQSAASTPRPEELQQTDGGGLIAAEGLVDASPTRLVRDTPSSRSQPLSAEPSVNVTNTDGHHELKASDHQSPGAAPEQPTNMSEAPKSSGSPDDAGSQPTPTTQPDVEHSATVDAIEMNEAADTDTAYPEAAMDGKAAPFDPHDGSDLYDTLDATTIPADLVALESPPFSPAPAEISLGNNDDDGDTDMQEAVNDLAALPAQISDVPAADPPFDEQAGNAGEVLVVSPATVGGGLKSLTYSSKINPIAEMCPYEVDGGECPNGPSCQFQHFQSMVPKDDQILVELGKSDDFSSSPEQRSRFVQGLREVLHKFRTEKVRDFNTIAEGIIGFRRQFIGDESRILSHLEGVSI